MCTITRRHRFGFFFADHVSFFQWLNRQLATLNEWFWCLDYVVSKTVYVHLQSNPTTRGLSRTTTTNNNNNKNRWKKIEINTVKWWIMKLFLANEHDRLVVWSFGRLVVWLNWMAFSSSNIVIKNLERLLNYSIIWLKMKMLTTHANCDWVACDDLQLNWRQLWSAPMTVRSLGRIGPFNRCLKYLWPMLHHS